MTKPSRRTTKPKVLVTIIVAALVAAAVARAQLVPPSSLARDPGARGGAAGAGDPLIGLTTGELAFFQAGQDQFTEVEGLSVGLGPRFNLDSCGGCHSQPAVGGTSPAVNPQVDVATKNGALNFVPSFVRRDGPIREARFRYRTDGGGLDGGVHDLFVISGRDDGDANARGCSIQQENFDALMIVPISNVRNIIFRIPTPVFGAGLIEEIPDAAIRANAKVNAAQKAALGIGGRPHVFNFNGNDGTVARFGWKAQNKSLLLFAGEAYNVEMGITSELFQTERDETPGCQPKPQPNNITATDGPYVPVAISDIEKFAFFMRFLAPPQPSPDTPGGAASIARGRGLFTTIGCALCHTPTLRTGTTTVGALNQQPVNLFSDLLLHHMGPGLADGINQGQAEGDEFRTAPLWGLGQRLFFLHDGRTANVVAAILAHYSVGVFQPQFVVASEANAVITRFGALSASQQQDVVNRWFGPDGASESWQWRRLPDEFHGSGCTLAAALAARLAHGDTMRDAIAAAQAYCQRTLENAYAIAPGQLIPNRVIPFLKDM